MKQTEIFELDDLYALKRARSLNEVVLHTKGFKLRGALRHALKYSLWSLAVGGRLLIVDSGPKGFRIGPYSIPFSFVRQQTFKTLGRHSKLLRVDDAAMTISLERTSKPLESGWTAGVLFSGAPEEARLVQKAIEGLQTQPELLPGNGGQIIVCGPPGGEHVVRGLNGIEYLPHAEDQLRPMVTRKKNAIASAARNPRLAIMHSRIVLQPGCLSSMPCEFDVITPRIEYLEGDSRIAYLDFQVEAALDLERIPTREPPLNTYDRFRYLDILRLGRPYIDGGLFMARRDIVRAVPLNLDLAWGEAEDLEWSASLHSAGYLVDLEPSALAVSQTFKLPRAMIDTPVIFGAARRINRLYRLAAGKFTYLTNSDY